MNDNSFWNSYSQNMADYASSALGSFPDPVTSIKNMAQLIKPSSKWKVSETRKVKIRSNWDGKIYSLAKYYVDVRYDLADQIKVGAKYLKSTIVQLTFESTTNKFVSFEHMRQGDVYFDGSDILTDNANGTVTDKLTGLIWLKNANCLGKQSWTAAMTAANTLASGACGLSDSSTAGQWRLPSDTELQIFVANLCSTPDLPSGLPFPRDYEHDYWSSSDHGWESTAWYVRTFNGSVNTDYKGRNFYVWPVRSAQIVDNNKTVDASGFQSYYAPKLPKKMVMSKHLREEFSNNGTVLSAVLDSQDRFTNSDWGEISSEQAQKNKAANGGKGCVGRYPIPGKPALVIIDNGSDVFGRFEDEQESK